MDWGKKWLVDFTAGKTQLDSFDQSNSTGAIDVKIDGSALEEKSYFKMLGLTFSSNLDWGSYIVSIAKTASNKIEALICSMKFLFPEVALYLYKSTISPCLDIVATWNCWISYKNGYAGLLVLHLVASLEHLALHQNVASLSLFYSYYFGRCSSELTELVPLPYSQGRSARYSDRLHDFSVTIPRWYKDVYVNSFFLRAARPWNSLPIKCFPFNCGFFLNRFPVCFNLFVLLSCVTPCLVVAVPPCKE